MNRRERRRDKFGEPSGPAPGFEAARAALSLDQRAMLDAMAELFLRTRDDISTSAIIDRLGWTRQRVVRVGRELDALGLVKDLELS